MQRLQISDTETRGIILSRQQTTKVLIRLRIVLFAYGRNRFSHDVARIVQQAFNILVGYNLINYWKKDTCILNTALVIILIKEHKTYHRITGSISSV